MGFLFLFHFYLFAYLLEPLDGEEERLGDDDLLGEDERIEGDDDLLGEEERIDDGDDCLCCGAVLILFCVARCCLAGL